MVSSAGSEQKLSRLTRRKQPRQAATYKPETRVSVQCDQILQSWEPRDRLIVRHKVDHGGEDERWVEVDEERSHFFERVEDQTITPCGDTERQRAVCSTVAPVHVVTPAGRNALVSTAHGGRPE